MLLFNIFISLQIKLAAEIKSGGRFFSIVHLHKGCISGRKKEENSSYSATFDVLFFTYYYAAPEFCERVQSERS